MGTRKNLITTLLVGGLGGLGGFILYKLLRMLREERPPIRVRGGSISFETACGWKEAGKADDEWVQNLEDPPPVTRLVVTIIKGSTTKLLEGHTVHFNQGAAMLSLRIDKNGEPRLGPRSRLPKEPGSGHKRVKDSQSSLNNVHVIPNNPPEDLDEGHWLEVTFK